MSSIRPITLTLIILAVGHFCVDFMIGIWAIFKTLAGLDLAMAGAIAGICSFIGEGSQIFFGSLSDRGYYKYVVLGGMIFTTAALLLPSSEGYLFFFIFYLLTCIGSGAFHPSAVGLLGKLAGSRKTFVISIFAVGGSLGMAMSHFSFKQAYQYLTVNTWLLSIPVIIFASLSILHAFGRNLPGYQRQSMHPTSHWEIFKYFKRRDLTHLYFVQMANQVFAWGTLFLLPDVLLTRGYEDWITFGGGHFFYIVGACFLMAPAGYLADKLSSRTVLITGYFLGLMLFYTFWFFPQIPAPYVLILLFCMGATIGTLNPVCVAFGTKLDQKNPGMVSAFLMGMVWCVSEVLGPAGGGLLTKLFSEDAPANALAVLSFAMFAGLLLSFWLPTAEEERAQLEFA